MTIRVFMSGQSNALGRGAGGPSFSLVDPRVLVWNNVNPGGGQAQSGPYGTAFISPSRASAPFDPSGGWNIGLAFCHRLAQVRETNVQYLLCGQGGSSLKEWVTPEGGAGPVLAHSISAWSASGQDPAHVFLWHQGEGDTTEYYMTFGEYRSRFVRLLGHLMAAGVIDANTVVIVGGTAEENPDRIAFNNEVLRVLAAANPNIHYASSEGLETYDGSHFMGQDLYAFGADRYWEAYAAATPASAAKSILTSSEFSGVPGVSGLLSSAMLAAGAIVEDGIHPTNGYYCRLERGLQVCATSVGASHVTSTVLDGNWTFPRPFKLRPFVFSALDFERSAFTPGQTQIAECYPLAISDVGCTVRLSRQAGEVGFNGSDTAQILTLAAGFWK